MSGTSVNKRLPVGTHPEFLAHEWLAVRVLENFYLRHRLRKNAAMVRPPHSYSEFVICWV
jgi:hypothetical protein